MTNGGRAYALPPFSFGPSSAPRPGWVVGPVLNDNPAGY